MNPNKLKELLKHIILEVNSQFEMIANKDAIPEPMAAVNVEENLFHGDVKKKAKDLFGTVKKIVKVSHPDSNSDIFKIVLQNPEAEYIIRKDKEGKLSLGKEIDGKLKFAPIDEETGTGAVAGYATPFAFKPTGGAGERRRKKKKRKDEKTNPDGTYSDDMEDGRRSNRISGMNENSVPNVFSNTTDLEKQVADAIRTRKTHINLDGHSYATGYVQYILNKSKKQKPLAEVAGTQYFAMVPVGAEFKVPGQPHTFRKIDKDTALLGRKRVKIKNDTLVNIHGGLNEMTSSSAAGGQPGGTIQTPAWGTKNALGSPRGIKGSEKLGYKVVKSITK